MLDDRHNTRNQQEHGAANMGPADKFGNRAGAAKAARGVPGKPHSESPVPAVTGRPRLELSLTQILGSTGAAVTAAFLGSRLGVAGTLIGAALASIISVVGGAIYTTSIKATRHRVAQALVAVRGQDEEEPNKGQQRISAPVAPARPAIHTARQPVVASRPTGAGRARGAAPGRARHPAFRGVLIGAVLSVTVFVAALVVVTGYETVSGTALAGGRPGGLTVLGGRQPDAGSDQVTVTSTTGTSGAKVGPTTTSSSTGAPTTAESGAKKATAPAGTPETHAATPTSAEPTVSSTQTSDAGRSATGSPTATSTRGSDSTTSNSVPATASQPASSGAFTSPSTTVAAAAR